MKHNYKVGDTAILGYGMYGFKKGTVVTIVSIVPDYTRPEQRLYTKITGSNEFEWYFYSDELLPIQSKLEKAMA